MGFARTAAQPPHTRRHLRANYQTRRRRMRIFLTLLRRELGGFFLSPTGYVIIAAVTLILGLTYDVLMTNLVGGEPQDMPITELFYASYIFWLIVVLISPVITMRLFAQEKY